MVSPDAGSRRPIATLLALIVCALLATPHAEAREKKKKPTGIVTGVVLSMQDEPLAGVTVKLAPSEGGDPAPTATTDSKGEFSIKIPVGEYTLHLSKDGFTPFTQPVLIDSRRNNLRVQMLDSSMGQRNVAINAYNRAVEALEAEDAAAAIRHLEESVAADPTFLEPLDLLATLQFDEGAFVESAAAAERYLTLDPDNRKVQTRAYAAYVQSGNQPKIDEWRNRLTQTGSTVAMSKDVYNEGARAVQAGDMDKAAERFRQAVDLNPDLAEAHASLSTILYNNEQLDEALAAADRALALKPQDASSLRVRVLVHEATGDRAKADTAIKAYAAVAPDDAIKLLSTKAELDFKAGRREEAATAWLNALEIEPDRPEAHYKLGLIYADNDTAKARMYLERFIALAPTAPEAATAKELLATF